MYFLLLFNIFTIKRVRNKSSKLRACSISLTYGTLALQGEPVKRGELYNIPLWAGFSLRRDLFRKNVGVLPIIRIARLNSHDTHRGQIIDISLRTRIT